MKRREKEETHTPPTSVNTDDGVKVMILHLILQRPRVQTLRPRLPPATPSPHQQHAHSHARRHSHQGAQEQHQERHDTQQGGVGVRGNHLVSRSSGGGVVKGDGRTRTTGVSGSDGEQVLHPELQPVGGGG